jgi:hypothetical protein
MTPRTHLYLRRSPKESQHPQHPIRAVHRSYRHQSEFLLPSHCHGSPECLPLSLRCPTSSRSTASFCQAQGTDTSPGAAALPPTRFFRRPSPTYLPQFRKRRFVAKLLHILSRSVRHLHPIQSSPPPSGALTKPYAPKWRPSNDNHPSMVPSAHPTGASPRDHKSAHDHVKFLREEYMDMIRKGHWTVLPASNAIKLPHLRLSPLGVVPQREHRPQTISDYSFYGVNAEPPLLRLLSQCSLAAQYTAYYSRSPWPILALAPFTCPSST